MDAPPPASASHPDPERLSAPVRRTTRSRTRGRIAALAWGAVLASAAVVAGLLAPPPGAPATEWATADLTPRIAAGAAPLGEVASADPLPADAWYVAPDAAPGGDGSIEGPFPRVQDALDRVSGTGTIVLRAGVFHEAVFVGKSKSVTIRAYPGEEVWFDGTEAIADWTPEGGVWRTPWGYEFSSAPSYTGGEDGTERNWQFLDENHPFAAHPEQVWVDGEPLRQVAPDEVAPGTFALDPERGELVLGEDPAGRDVRASTLQRAFQVRSPDSVLSGFGVRRYAPSIVTMGSVVMEGDRALVEDLVIEDASTIGLFVTGTGSTVRDVTIRRSGMIGATANFADQLTLDGLLIEHNNTEKFNQAPVSGGFKVSRSRHLVIENSVVRANAGPGIWLDQSVYDTTIHRSDIIGNAGHGIFAEISERVALVDLVVVGNGRIGVKINDTGDVVLWRSTVVGNGLAVAVLQDTRRASDLDIPGHDDRQPQPDPDMPWVVSDIRIGDSILGDVRGSKRDLGAQPAAPVWVQDYSNEFTAQQLIASVTSTVLHRAEANAPLAVWQTRPGPTSTYTSLAEWSRVFGATEGVVEIRGGSPIDAGFRATGAVGAPVVGTVPEVVERLLGGVDRGVGALVP